MCERKLIEDIEKVIDAVYPPQPVTGGTRIKDDAGMAYDEIWKMPAGMERTKQLKIFLKDLKSNLLKTERNTNLYYLEILHRAKETVNHCVCP